MAPLVMVSNQVGTLVGYLAGRFPGRIGHLFSPGGVRGGPYPFIPYALDNGRFTPEGWCPDKFLAHVEWAMNHRQKPLWVSVPDVVGDRSETLRDWDRWHPRLAGFNLPLAFVVQDGMTENDVPSEADLVFVGGSLEWKWRTVEMWAETQRRVHVGRVNSVEKLVWLDGLGVESIDGTGGWHNKASQRLGLLAYLEGRKQGRLFR